MIKRLQIKNFMSIHQATLELGRINVFIGKSDAGKSTVLRAIDALHTNKYPAVRFATHDTPQYTVAEVTESGVAQIVKSKTTAFKTLQVIDGEKVEHEYNAAGREIPVPVEKIINQPIFQLDPETSLDVLYASQHTPFFLIQEDKTTFTKVISKVANADRIKSLEALVDGDIRSNKKKVTMLKGQIIDYDNSIAVKEAQLSVLKPFESLKALTDSIKADHEATDLSIKRWSDLAAAKTETINLESALATLKPLEVPDSTLVDKLAETRSLLAILETPIPNTLDADTPASEKLLEAKSLLGTLMAPLPEKLTVETQADKLADVKALALEIKRLDSEADKLNDEKDQIDALLNSLVGQVCPVCGSVITKESVENV